MALRRRCPGLLVPGLRFRFTCCQSCSPAARPGRAASSARGAWIVGARRPRRGRACGAAHACSSPTMSAGSTSWSSAARPAAPSCRRTISATRCIDWLADQNHTVYVSRDAREGRQGPGARDRQGAGARPAGRAVPRRHDRAGRRSCCRSARPCSRRRLCAAGRRGPAGGDRLWRGGAGHRLDQRAGHAPMSCGSSGRKGTLPVTRPPARPLDRVRRPQAARRGGAGCDCRKRSASRPTRPSPIGARRMTLPRLSDQELRLPDERL